MGAGYPTRAAIGTAGRLKRDAGVVASGHAAIKPGGIAAAESARVVSGSDLTMRGPLTRVERPAATLMRRPCVSRRRDPRADRSGFRLLFPRRRGQSGR